MSTWNAMTPEAKDTILRVVRQEAEQFFDLVDSDEAWEAPTGAGHWQVRDVVGHLVDTTEAYFVSFDAARNDQEVDPAYGLPGMAARCDEMAQAFRSVPRTELVERARARLRQDDGDVRRADRRGLDRPAGPALLHGPAAVVLLPGLPADGLRRALLGRPPGHRPGARAVG